MIAGAVMAGVLLAMFLFEFGLGAPGEHSIVPATVIESRVDEFIDGQGCVKEDAVAQLDLSHVKYASVVYLRDNPSRSGSYLKPRVEYRHHYDTGLIEAISNAASENCY